MKNIKRASVVAVATVAATAAAGTMAYAFWTTAGAGAGTAKATTLIAPTVVAGAAPAGQLFPGLVANGTTAGGDLVVNATNPNGFPITVTITGGTFAGCATPAVSIGSPASFVLAANAAAAERTISKVLSMGTASSNDCQGKDITITNLVTSSSTAP